MTRPVPQLCEHCFGPIGDEEAYVRSDSWSSTPDSQLLITYMHHGCHKQALARQDQPGHTS